MYSRARLARKYLHYYLTASNGKGHGIHSPFVYAFVKNVLNDDGVYPAYDAVEKMRARLSADRRMLEIEDWGAGSVLDGEATVEDETVREERTVHDERAVREDKTVRGLPGVREDELIRGVGGIREDGWVAKGETRGDVGRAVAEVSDRDEEGIAAGAVNAKKEKNEKNEGKAAVQARTRFRSVSQLAVHAAKSRKLGQLLFRIAHYYQPRTILELGTCLGISTAYLSYGAPKAKLLTIEGAPAIADEAEKNFRDLGLHNIEVVTGNFEDWLPLVLDRLGGIELAFIDGNHRKEPTLRYFHLLMGRVVLPAVLIFDDIHWSAGMEEAWETIRRDPRVLLTVDLFFVGLVFLREEFKRKQDFVIRF
ncbi:MAG: class I SAM-dependent methyltransferase [Puia sp.]|nr:class I SAM-dependent methyltransferase [Puia sp.]